MQGCFFVWRNIFIRIKALSIALSLDNQNFIGKRNTFIKLEYKGEENTVYYAAQLFGHA